MLNWWFDVVRLSRRFGDARRSWRTRGRPLSWWFGDARLSWRSSVRRLAWRCGESRQFRDEIENQFQNLRFRGAAAML